MISSTVLTLIVIPAVYALIKGFGLPRGPDVAVPVDLDESDRTATGMFEHSRAAE